MRGEGFTQDQRSVSEIYGTVLIISLAFLVALLLVGAGWVVVDQLTTESRDGLAQDSMQSVDQGIDDISGGSVNETTTFQFPDDTGTDVSAEENSGMFNVTITTANETYWNRTVAEKRGFSEVGWNQTVLGTIKHEAEDGGVTAFQGGGLWRKPDPDGATFIESEPNLGFTGDTLDLGVVNLTNLDAITEGAEVRATQNAEAQTAEELQAFMALYWTDRYNPSVTAPVEVNITIESEYADGWATYAEERMAEDPARVIHPFNGDDNKVRIVFGKIGDGLDVPSNPTFGNNVLYSGTSDWAYEHYNDSVGEVSGNATAFNVTDLTPPPGSVQPNHYSLALYNESGQWLIYERKNPGDSGEWVDSDGNSVDPSHTEAIVEVENNTNPNDHDLYQIKPPREVEAATTPVCIVAEPGLSPSSSKSITDYLDTEGDGCLANMVGVDEDLVDPIQTSPDFNVTIEDVDATGSPTGAILPEDMYVGEEMIVTVNLSNEGDGAGQIPLGLYTLNESNWKGSGNTSVPEPYTNRSYLLNGTQSADNELDPGNYTTRDYVVTAERFMANDEWVVFATTGTDTDWVNDPGEATRPYDTVEVLERPSNFAIQSASNISLSDPNPDEGDYVEVTVEVNETQRAISGNETQTVRLESDNRVINQTEITLGPGPDDDWKDTVTMGWTVRDGTAPEVNLTASTYDDNQDKTVSVNDVAVPEPEFEVTITNVEEDVVAGEKLDVEAEVENVGGASGDTYVELANFDGELADVVQVSGLGASNSTTVTLTWQTQVGDNGTDDLTVAVENDSDTAQATVKAPGVTNSDFQVDITGTNSPVPAGQELTVDATITNNGSEADTQFVYLTNPDGDTTDFAEVSLDPGNDTDLTLRWETGPGDGGSGSMTVASDDDDDSTGVTVQSPTSGSSEFEVDIQGDNFGVTAGDALTVDVNVTNSGNETDEQIVYLENFDGKIVDTVEVGPLDPGDTVSVPLTWDTTINDAGKTGTLSVASNDNTDTASAEVFNPNTDESNFKVTIQETNSPVVESEQLTVTATIENTGNSSDTQFVVLENFDGGPVAVKEISLSSASGSNASVTTTFTWDTIVGDADTGQVSVVSADDTASTDAKIKPKESEERAPLDVVLVMDESGSMNDDACDTCAQTKAEAAVDASQNAVGSLNESKDRVGVVFFDTNSQIRKTQGDELYGNGVSDFDKVNNTIGTHSPGGGTLSGEGMADAENILADENDPDREKVVVLLSDGANNGCKYNQTALLNEDPRDCGGSNDDSLGKTQNLADDDVTTYAVGYGNPDPSEGDVEIDPAFLQATAAIGGGEYYNASNDEQLANAFDEIFDEITEPDTPTFDVTITGTTDPVESGETLEVDVKVENTGAAPGEGIVSLADFADTNVDSVTTSNLSVGESETLTLEWDTTGQAAAIDDVTVTTVDDTDTQEVNVTAPSATASDFVVQSVNPDSPVTEGDTLTVETTVFNDGAADTQDIVLWDMGQNQVVDTTEITLNNSKQQTVTLEWDTAVGDAGSGDIMVASADHNQTAPVEVLADDGGATPFNVDINEGASTLTVTEGDTVTFDVTVTNTGNETDSQQIYLEDYDGNGLLDATDTGTLGPGDSTNVTLTWDTSSGDAPLNQEFTVTSETDDDTANVTVNELSNPDSDFQVDINETASDDQAVAGNTLSVTAEITNRGDSMEQNVVLWDFGNNSVVDVQAVDLESGNSTNVTFTWTTDEDDVGTGQVTVESDDDADTTNAEVLEPDDLSTDLEIVNVNPDSATAGDTLDAEVTITNNGSADAVGEWISMELNDRNSSATVDGDYRQVDINASETKTFDMSVETTDSTTGDYNLTVETNADEQTEVVTIDPPSALFDVNILSTNEPVTEGEKLEVTAEVTNNNAAPGTDEVTVVLNDTRSGTFVDMVFDVEIARGDSKQVDLVWATEWGDGDDDSPVKIRAEIANSNRYDAEDVLIEEARNDLDNPSMGEPGNPLNIDLEEIEIGT